MQSARAVVSLSTFTRESGTWPRDCRLRSAGLLEQNSIGSDTTRPKQYTDVRRDSGNTSGMQNICPPDTCPTGSAPPSIHQSSDDDDEVATGSPCCKYTSSTTSRSVFSKSRTASTNLLLLLHPFNGLFSRTTRVSRYKKGKTNLDSNEARDDGVLRWQWHQLDHMQTICTSLQRDNHTNTSSLNSYRPDVLPDAQQCQSTEGNR